jgi:protein SCO1/2
MNPRRNILVFLASLAIGLLVGCREAPVSPQVEPTSAPTTYSVTGVIKALKPAEKIIIIKHDEITNFMVAMTMPFSVLDSNLLIGLSAGDQVTFELCVTADTSWIQDLTKIGATTAPPPSAPSRPALPTTLTNSHPLLDYKFTNEFGQLVSFNDFKGRALAFTFFFTRCPLPEYCPRLMKNFVQASEKLRAHPAAPTNWHFLAITFDPKFDTPAVLRNYAQHYQSDSNHWSFLTGDPERIAALAHFSGVTYEPDGVFFNHNFRTLVVDAAGQLQMSFPIGGDISDLLVTEILKATAVTNR